MGTKKQSEDVDILFDFVDSLKQQHLSAKEQKQLLAALLTPSEREAISQRIVLLKKLIAKQPQREISAQMSMGIATVTRGNRILKENKELLERILL